MVHLSVEVYTDGGTRQKGKVGSWAATLRCLNVERYLGGVEADTTNNRMELMGPISALRALTRPTNVTVYCDSQYVVYGITRWISKWKRNGWQREKWRKSGDGGWENVANRDLWEQLDQLNRHHTVTWKWVRGHDGNPGNEEADRLVNELMDRVETGIPVSDVSLDERTVLPTQTP